MVYGNKKLFLVLIFVFFLLAIRYLLYAIYYPNLHPGNHISFTTTLTNEPQVFSTYNLIIAKYTNFWSYEKISVKYNPQISLSYGDSITITGDVISSKNNKLLIAMVYPQIKANFDSQNRILALTNSIRQNVKNLYENTLSSTDAGLLLGIVLGAKANFSKTFQSYLSTTGTMHIIAASGMNVSMVAGFLFGICAFLFRRRVAVIGAMSGVVMYMILAGLQASILRAGIMAIIAFSSQLIGRQHSALYGLALTIVILLLYDPMLVEDVGFQLSAGATLGILLLKPLLSNIAFLAPIDPDSIGVKSGLDDINTTIAAQIATLPILLTTFGTYGILSVFVNALILWTVPLITILGGVGAIISVISQPLGILLIQLTQPLLWWMETVIIFFGKLGWNVQVSSINWEMVVGYYLLLLTWILSCALRKTS